MLSKRLAVAGAMVLFCAGVSSSAIAQDATPSLADLSTDSNMAAAFAAMVGDRKMPEWVTTKAVTSPADIVQFAGQDYLAMTACEQHLCGPHRIAVLYDAASGTMYGLLSTADGGESTENLIWLNIGGGPESIDGKTLLYAAIAGSVANHPEDFNYAPERTD